MLQWANFKNFTCLPNEQWQFGAGINIIVGENGVEVEKASRLHPIAIEPDKLQDQLRRRLKALDPHALVLSTQAEDKRAPWQLARTQ
ncbi:hypothetical protein V8J88_09830 [Massilia sp. W12]|uniref:hypothetical protein n=1 Tax=Massilia sp. W12 TaxID=3126507 RepID=UPI0030D0352D